MKQYEQVIYVMRENGGYATLGFLNQNVDVSTWKSSTPFASIRRIVQDDRFFFRIRPGLWALNEFKKEILLRFNLHKKAETGGQEQFNHTYYQGLLVEIGNLKKLDTFIPAQDKNKLFLEKALGTVSNLDKIFEFTYPEIIGRAKTIDVVWFNNRKMPHSFFEVEHSTDIQNSLLKFWELQDFKAQFYIVSSQARKKEYEKKISYGVFRDIKDRTKFIDYDYVSNLHTKSFELSQIDSL